MRAWPELPCCVRDRRARCACLHPQPNPFLRRSTLPSQVGYTLPGFSLEVTAADQQQDVQLLISVVRRAAAEYGSARYLELQQHCMALDASWDRPAAEWEQLLQRMAASATAAGRAAAASTATDQQAAA